MERNKILQELLIIERQITQIGSREALESIKKLYQDILESKVAQNV